MLGGVSLIRQVTNPKVALWLTFAAILAVPLILLTIALNDGQIPSQDQSVLDWASSRDLPLLGGISESLSAITDAFPTAGIGIAVVAFLWLLGMNRTALGFLIVGVVVFIVAVLGDLIL